MERALSLNVGLEVHTKLASLEIFCYSRLSFESRIGVGLSSCAGPCAPTSVTILADRKARRSYKAKYLPRSQVTHPHIGGHSCRRDCGNSSARLCCSDTKGQCRKPLQQKYEYPLFCRSIQNDLRWIGCVETELSLDMHAHGPIPQIIESTAVE